MKKRIKSRDGIVRWSAEKPEDGGNYGALVASADDGTRMAILNAGTPDWNYLGREDCKELADNLMRCYRDKEFWSGKLKFKPYSSELMGPTDGNSLLPTA